MRPARPAETIRVTPTPGEAEVYRRVSERVGRAGRTSGPRERLSLWAVQHLAGSSPASLAPMLERLGWNDLSALTRSLPPTAKAGVLLAVLRRHLARGEKVVVFTAFRPTLDALSGLLEEQGIEAALYYGGLPRRAKEEAIEAFRMDAPVLHTTEAGGEGRNLQFFHAMVNFDPQDVDLGIDRSGPTTHR